MTIMQFYYHIENLLSVFSLSFCLYNLINYILNLNEYIVMEYYSISCINYCSFVNIYKCFIPKERTMFGDEF